MLSVLTASAILRDGGEGRGGGGQEGVTQTDNNTGSGARAGTRADGRTDKGGRQTEMRQTWKHLETGRRR